MSSSRRQFGRPEKSSPSHHTVPASSASRSVCDIGGISLRNAASTPSLMSLRRSAGTASASANATKRTVNNRFSASGSACAYQDTASATATASPHARPEALT